jgi:hypothetical protein
MAKVHQIFVGCPFRSPVRRNYDKLKRELERESPLHVVLADTTAISSSDYLLEHITTLIRESAGCIFDVTGGNPNVSLEVGIAHALPADFILTMYTRRPRSAAERQGTGALIEPSGEVKPIISDLQGRNRIEYKTYAALKRSLLERYLKPLPYMRRWAEFQRRHTSYTPFAIRVFDEIRTSGRTVRPRVDAMLYGSGIRTTELADSLRSQRLLVISRGREGGYFYPSG